MENTDMINFYAYEYTPHWFSTSFETCALSFVSPEKALLCATLDEESLVIAIVVSKKNI